MKCFLYFERILEQTERTRMNYIHGVVTDKNKIRWMERQRKYLVPLLRHRLRLIEDPKTNPYALRLFAYFCDQKSEVNLSCIGQEIQFMDRSLKEILFVDSDGDHDDCPMVNVP